MAYRTSDKRHIYIKVHPDKHGDVVDALLDADYTIGECAEWYYWAQTDKTNPNHKKGAVCYEVDRNDYDYNFEPKKK